MLAVSRKNRGDLLLRKMEYSAALAEFQAATEIVDKLANEFPKRPVYRVELARTYYQLGVLYGQESKPDQARQAWDSGEKLLMELQAEQKRRDAKAVFEYRKELQDIWTGLVMYHDHEARRLDQEKKWPEAVAHVTRLVQLRERMRNETPENVETRVELAATRLSLANLLLEAKRPVAASKPLLDLSKSRKELPREWGKLHVAAIQLARCLELAGSDTSASPLELELLEKNGVGECLRLLRDAVDRGEEIVISANDFRTLRNDQRFQELLAEIEKKRTPKPPVMP
jgi:tetratricopeptide (TPR) repeat protein